MELHRARETGLVLNASLKYVVKHSVNTCGMSGGDYSDRLNYEKALESLEIYLGVICDRSMVEQPTPQFGMVVLEVVCSKERVPGILGGF